MLMVVGITITVVGAFISILQGLLSEKPDLLCKRPIFLIIRAGGGLVILFFLTVGIILTKTLKKLERETLYERTKQKRR